MPHRNCRLWAAPRTQLQNSKRWPRSLKLLTGCCNRKLSACLARPGGRSFLSGSPGSASCPFSSWPPALFIVSTLPSTRASLPQITPFFPKKIGFCSCSTQLLILRLNFLNLFWVLYLCYSHPSRKTGRRNFQVSAQLRKEMFSDWSYLRYCLKFYRKSLGCFPSQ